MTCLLEIFSGPTLVVFETVSGDDYRIRIPVALGMRSNLLQVSEHVRVPILG